MVQKINIFIIISFMLAACTPAEEYSEAPDAADVASASDLSSPDQETDGTLTPSPDLPPESDLPTAPDLHGEPDVAPPQDLPPEVEDLAQPDADIEDLADVEPPDDNGIGDVGEPDQIEADAVMDAPEEPNLEEPDSDEDLATEDLGEPDAPADLSVEDLGEPDLEEPDVPVDLAVEDMGDPDMSADLGDEDADSCPPPVRPSPTEPVCGDGFCSPGESWRTCDLPECYCQLDSDCSPHGYCSMSLEHHDPICLPLDDCGTWYEDCNFDGVPDNDNPLHEGCSYPQGYPCLLIGEDEYCGDCLCSDWEQYSGTCPEDC